MPRHRFPGIGAWIQAVGVRARAGVLVGAALVLSASSVAAALPPAAAATDPGPGGTASVGVVLDQPNQDYGLSQLEEDHPGDGATKPVTLGGQSGRTTIEDYPGDTNMYFKVDDRVAHDGSYQATFTFEYYDQGSQPIYPQYDSTNPNGGPFSGAYTNGPTVQETGSGTWKTATFTVSDARFASRQNGGADFRLNSPSPFTVHSMSVKITGNGVNPVTLWPPPPSPPPGAPPSVRILSVKPTPLFANAAGQPQIADVWILNSGNAGQVTFTATTDGAARATTLNVPFGASDQQVDVVPAAGPGPASLAITTPAGESAQAQLPYQRRWQLYLIHGSHQDIGYNGVPSAMRQEQEQYIDTAVKECQATANYPADARFHWTIEHAWTLENYVADRSSSQVQALADCLHSGQFELAGSYDNQLYDLASPEQIVRALYAGTRTLAGRFGVQPDAALQDDVTGVTWQDIQMLAKSGIKYLMNGANPTRAPRPQNDPALFWWKAPNGSRILTWYSGPDSYCEGFSVCGLGFDRPLSDFPAVTDKVSGLLSQLQGEGYQRDIYPIQMFLDNTAPVTTLPDLVTKWNQDYSYPRLIFSTPTPFFKAISQEDPGSIPTYSGDWSGWWSDGAGSSAHETAENRQAQARTTAAETLGGLSSLTAPASQVRQETLDQAYRQEELYTEHTWGAASPSYTDPEWPYKQAHAINADQLSSKALASASGGLAGQMSNPSPWPQVAVFNSLSWPRNGPVQATVPEGKLAGQPFQLVDSAGHAVPYELVSRAAGQISLRFVAAGVPSAGYATYQLVPATGTPATGSDPALHASSTGLENQYFRITLDPVTGTIKSIYDKARGQELIDPSSSFQANQFVYRPNCAGANKVSDCPTSAAHQWSPARGSVKVLSSGPASATVEVTADPGAGGATTGITGLTQRITLYAGNPKVYIADTVDKARVDTAEEAYFAFPFKVDSPQITYEAPGTPVRFFTDQMPGSALDWQAIQSYADVSNASGGVTFSSPDAPLAEFGHIRTQEFLTRPGRLDGKPGQPGPSPYLPTNGSIFSYAYNNLWFTNYRIAQEGTTTFHYTITSHAGGFDPVRATHDGWDSQTPLVPVAVPGQQHGAYNPGDHSLVSVDQPDVVVQTIKQAADGAPGLTLRLLEVGGHSGEAGLHLPFQVGAATVDNPTEQPQSALAPHGRDLRVPIEAHGIVTVTIQPQLTLTASAPASSLPTQVPVTGTTRTSDTPLVPVPQLARGHSLPVTVTLANHTGQTVKGNLSISQAGGLTVTPDSAPITIAPGATARATFTITAPGTMPTGPVTITATASTGASSATPTQITLNVTDQSASP